jgi:hypothetical protein
MRKALILITGLAAFIIPASAQISADQAMDTCRAQVRQNASGQFGPNIQFRNTNLNDNAGIRDRVEGTFVVPRGEGEEVHTFACSINMANGNLRSVQIDSAAVSANPTAYTDAQAMDTCRDAVRGRIHDLGYGAVDFNSIAVDNTPGRSDWVVGRANGNRSDSAQAFNFSCQVNRNTGGIRSLEVTGR